MIEQLFFLKLVGFNIEASFKGQNALTFMKKMGYEFKPVQQTIYEKTSEMWVQGPGSHSFTFKYGEIVKITEKSRYLQKGMTEISRYPLTKGMIDQSLMPLTIMETNRYKINYTNSTYLKTSLFIKKLMIEMGGTHDYRRTKTFKGWGNYIWYNNGQVNLFRELYGDE